MGTGLLRLSDAYNSINQYGNSVHRWYGPTNESTLWQIYCDPTKEYKHPTQKPLELAERAMRNSSRRSQIVLDTKPEIRPKSAIKAQIFANICEYLA